MSKSAFKTYILSYICYDSISYNYTVPFSVHVRCYTNVCERNCCVVNE